MSLYRLGFRGKNSMSKHLLFLPSAKYNCSSMPGLASEHRLPGMSARCRRKEKQSIQGPRKREYQRSSKSGYRKHLCAQTQVTMVPIRLELTWPYQKAATNFQGCSYWGELQPVAVGQEQTVTTADLCGTPRAFRYITSSTWYRICSEARDRRKGRGQQDIGVSC